MTRRYRVPSQSRLRSRNYSRCGSNAWRPSRNQRIGKGKILITRNTSHVNRHRSRSRSYSRKSRSESWSRENRKSRRERRRTSAARRRYYANRQRSHSGHFSTDIRDACRSSKDIMGRRFPKTKRSRSISSDQGSSSEFDRSCSSSIISDCTLVNYCKRCSQILRHFYPESYIQSATKSYVLSLSNDEYFPSNQASSSSVCSSSKISLYSAHAKVERSPKFYIFTDIEDPDHNVNKKIHSKNHQKNKKKKKKKTKFGHKSVISSHHYA
ncbi:hypothetical protein T02_5121 [Trichinella nativa]|uniref:Uncharacterized protein n=1 Tax=Trichinella nativa TaxID=6335 RepID=A0A0V1KPJ2_9BILA|nr:hypothetical protein T02_5121 [Trichinella nativa]